MNYAISGLCKKYPTEWRAWWDAKRRCQYQKHKYYGSYGGRGILCKFLTFAEFMQHLGPKPKGCLLDRIDNNGHYEIGNVRWASPSLSVVNTRRRRDNTSGYKGVTRDKRKWCARIGGENTYIGSFATPEEASQAYEKAAAARFGTGRAI